MPNQSPSTSNQKNIWRQLIVCQGDKEDKVIRITGHVFGKQMQKDQDHWTSQIKILIKYHKFSKKYSLQTGQILEANCQ